MSHNPACASLILQTCKLLKTCWDRLGNMRIICAHASAGPEPDWGPVRCGPRRLGVDAEPAAMQAYRGAVRGGRLPGRGVSGGGGSGGGDGDGDGGDEGDDEAKDECSKCMVCDRYQVFCLSGMMPPSNGVCNTVCIWA